MPHRAILMPADDLFGRVALFNNLINLEQVVECARAIGAEIVAGRPRRSLATMLILKGHISAPSAGAVEAAIRRQRATQSGAGLAQVQLGPTPKPPPLAERAPDGTSQIVVALKDDTGFVESPATEERLRRIVARISPGLIHPEMLNYITRHQLSILDGRHLAAAIGEPEAEVFAALQFWQNAGVLKAVGTYPYCFSPGPHDEQDIAFLMEAWHDPHRHARVLGHILAMGK
jgi:hypothetical protein